MAESPQMPESEVQTNYPRNLPALRVHFLDERETGRKFWFLVAIFLPIAPGIISFGMVVPPLTLLLIAILTRKRKVGIHTGYFAALGIWQYAIFYLSNFFTYQHGMEPVFAILLIGLYIFTCLRCLILCLNPDLIGNGPIVRATSSLLRLPTRD